MILKAEWCKYVLDFRFTAITSRERMRHKDTYFIKISNADNPRCFGIGEAALFRGLGCDDRPDYEEKLSEVCGDIDRYAGCPALLADYPSIRFAVETATSDLANGGRRIIRESAWTRGESSILINGLVWMGDREMMRRRIAEKLDAGFSCVKIKIGGIDFEEEISLLDFIRHEAPSVQLRLDANGAFSPSEALEKLQRLSAFDIHSIEQPIRAGQWEEMRRLCETSPIPIALDEELIGLNDTRSKINMLDSIRPQYIILKSSLAGGIEGSEEWIKLASERNCGWWVTSALESNIGLNAIAQWVATLEPHIPQGLGTGQLYENNIPSPLSLHGDRLVYTDPAKWEIPQLQWNSI